MSFLFECMSAVQSTYHFVPCVIVAMLCFLMCQISTLLSTCCCAVTNLGRARVAGLYQKLGRARVSLKKVFFLNVISESVPDSQLTGWCMGGGIGHLLCRLFLIQISNWNSFFFSFLVVVGVPRRLGDALERSFTVSLHARGQVLGLDDHNVVERQGSLGFDICLDRSRDGLASVHKG